MYREHTSTGEMDHPLRATKRPENLREHQPGRDRPEIQLVFRVIRDWGREVLVFDNLGVEAGLARDAEYSARWYRFDNEEGSLHGLPERETIDEPRLSIPDDPARFLVGRVRTLAQDHPVWSQPVDVYLRNLDRREVVGIERNR